MSIIWSDKLKTGISLIDEQHQFIIKLLSDVKTSKLSKSDIFGLLSDLQDFLPVHFDTEERYMIDKQYPEYEYHKATHDKVLQDYKNILSQDYNDYSASEIALEVIKYMQKWFLEHYENEDVKMAKYLNQHQGS